MKSRATEWLCVRCAECGTFQGQQRTKNGKWGCRVCGAKQSLLKTFAVSYSASDIRKVVQSYNLARGDEQTTEPTTRGRQDEEHEEQNADHEEEAPAAAAAAAAPKRAGSMWAEFLKKDDRDEDDEEEPDHKRQKKVESARPEQRPKRAEVSTEKPDWNSLL